MCSTLYIYIYIYIYILLYGTLMYDIILFYSHFVDYNMSYYVIDYHYLL